MLTLKSLFTRSSASAPRAAAAVSRALVLCLGSGMLAASAVAQSFPSKQIHVIVPASVGTVVDTVGRLLALHMSKSLGQPLVVENLPAASGVPGTEKVVRSPKDGHTIAVVSNNHAINPGIFKSMPFDSLRDITPVGLIGSTPLVLVASPTLKAKDVRELVSIAKARPGALNYGSTGNGSVLHLAGVLLNAEAAIDVKHVPYVAFGQMLSDVLGGRLDIGFSGVAPVAGHISSGKLVAIGVSTKVRSSILPDVPTLAESGLPNYHFDGWLAMIAPAGTPKPVIDRLNAELNAALAVKEVQETLANLGVISAAGTVDAAARFFESEINKHQNMLKQAGVEPQ